MPDVIVPLEILRLSFLHASANHNWGPHLNHHLSISDFILLTKFLKIVFYFAYEITAEDQSESSSLISDLFSLYVVVGVATL